MKSRWLLGLMFLVLTATPSRSDDGIFGGEGDTVYPTTQTNIRMVSEMVKLKRHDRDISAQCEFAFMNSGPTEEITMGFPAHPAEDYDVENDKMVEYTTNLQIKNFKVWIDGHDVPYVLSTVDQDKKVLGIAIGTAFTWKARFPTGKLVVVKHTYNFYAGGDSGGDTGELVVIDYILKTGALWAGKMDWAVFDMDLGELVNRYNLMIEPPGFDYGNGKLHWKFKNFKPTQDIRVVVNPIQRDLRDIETEHCYINGLSEQELLLARNEVYARHGKIFKSKDLTEYFKKKGWYVPNPNFTEDQLTPEEKALIEKISEKEKAEGGSGE